MKNKILIFTYLGCVAAMLLFLMGTSHKGESNCLVIGNHSDTPNYHTLAPPKAIIQGDTVDYDAASDVRCDEAYKYYHLIGYGQIVGENHLSYLYRLNLKGYYVTVPELIAMHEQLINKSNVRTKAINR